MARATWSRLMLVMLCWYSLAATAQNRGLRALETAVPKPAGPRLALVIGNAAYAQPLRNPVADARAMAALLRELGFLVLERTNQDRAQLEATIRDFGDRLKGQQGVGLFYYAGHGMQLDGENYLIPVGAQLSREDEVRYQAVPIGLVLAKMETARNGTNIVILDACRDNPFRYSRSLQQGLATMNAPLGTFISYATAPGQVALDGDGKNGVYTGHLLREMKDAGAPIELVFKRVRQRVIAETRGRQVPWESTSLQGDFYFVPPAGAAEPLAPQRSEAAPAAAPPSVDRAMTSVGAGEVLAKTEQRGAMVAIPAGDFIMGSPTSELGRSDDEWHRAVRIGRGFWMGQTEVTQEQWVRIMGNNPSSHKGMELPVEQVSWLDAVTYCNRLSQAEGLTPCYQIEGQAVAWVSGLRCSGYRLPTEAEWEYAARAGQRTLYAGSDTLDRVAWYQGNSSWQTHAVSKLAPNPWGLYDMSGNVWEWVWDWYGAYPSGPAMDPIGKDVAYLGSARVLRGGSWGLDARFARVANRSSGNPSVRDAAQGFRLARSRP